MPTEIQLTHTKLTVQESPSVVEHRLDLARTKGHLVVTFTKRDGRPLAMQLDDVKGFTEVIAVQRDE